MLKISYQHNDGVMHVVEMDAPEIVRLGAEQAASRYAVPALAVILGRMKEHDERFGSDSD